MREQPCLYTIDIHRLYATYATYKRSELHKRPENKPLIGQMIVLYHTAAVGVSFIYASYASHLAVFGGTPMGHMITHMAQQEAGTGSGAR